MNRMLSIPSASLAVLLATAACGADEVFPVVHNEPIAVRVVDGKSGNAQPYTHVVLTAGYDRRDLALAIWREEMVTDAAGRAFLSDAIRNLPLLRIKVLKRHACEPGGNDAATSIERIRLTGLSAANRCGTFVFANAPGVLTVFVKGSRAGANKAEPQTNPEPTAAAGHPPPVARGTAATAAEKPGPVQSFAENEVDELLSEPN
jgi:hypothetical protein